MFNGYNETPLTSFNEYNHDEREKKQENVSKWCYGPDSGTQPTQHNSNRQAEFWSGKPSFLGISKCNCSGCYSSSENQSYQGESTRHRPWLPRSFPVPLNGVNESCKLPAPGYHQWDSLPNQGSCLPNSSIQYVQENGGKHSLYKHYQNSRLFEANQPGVITLVKDLKKDGLLKQKNEMTQEAMFQEQNETRQPMFYHPGYNLQRNPDKKYEGRSWNSSYYDSDEKYSNVEFYRHSVNVDPYSVNQHAARVPVVEPYIKAVPSNQNRVPSIDHRNIKENLPQSYTDQSYNESKIMYSEQGSNVGEKNARPVYHSSMEKEETKSFQTIPVQGLHSPMDLKSNGAHVNHLPFNVVMPCGNMEQQKLLFDTRHDFFSRNMSDIAKRNTATTIGDTRKDCAVGQVNVPEQRYPNSRSNHLSKYSGNLKGSVGVFCSPGEKISRTEKLDLQENTSCHPSNEDILNNGNARFSRSAVIFSDPRFCDKTENSFSYQSNCVYKSYSRSEYSNEGYSAQGRHENSSMSAGRQRNNLNQYKISHQTPNCGVEQFMVQGNDAFIFNPPYQNQRSESSDRMPLQRFFPDKSDLPVQVESPILSNHPEETRPLEMKKPNNYLETIRCEDVNKSGSSKISPLRLLRKKKFINQKSDSVPETWTLPTVNAVEAAPELDVRKFWSTWAEEEEENVAPTQMIVLDCQNIDPEQAKLLHLYESDPIRTVNLESTSILTFKNSECVKESVDNSEVNKEARLSLENLENQNYESQTGDTETKTLANKNFNESNSHTISVLPESVNMALSNTIGPVPVESQNVLEERTKGEAQPCKKARSSASQENKELSRYKKIGLEKKTEEFSRLDKWTEKKFDFLKRAEESRAAEILRHEEEKKKIFERRFSFQQVVSEVKKTKMTSKLSKDGDVDGIKVISGDSKNGEAVNEKVPERLSSFDENSHSNSSNDAIFSDLPTSEYRKNKFLDYSDGSIITNENHKALEEDVQGSQGKTTGCDILHFPLVSEVDEIKKEKIEAEYQNFSLTDKLLTEKLSKSETQCPLDKNTVNLKDHAGFEMDDILRKMSEVNVCSNLKHDENGANVKNEKSENLKILKSKKLEKEEEESDGETDKLTLEKISGTKPTIKFSIQKSHDLKISFKVLNGNSKKYESDEEGGGDEIESEENSVDNLKSATEMITFKLKGFQRKDSTCERNLGHSDIKVNNKRKLKKKRVQDDLRGRKMPVLRIRKSRYMMENEKDPLAEDVEFDNCSNLSNELYSKDHSGDFQVQETVDSAKIKLTFKRHKGGNYVDYKVNQNCLDKFSSGEVEEEDEQEEGRRNKKPRKERRRQKMLPQAISDVETVHQGMENISDNDSGSGDILDEEDSQKCGSEDSDGLDRKSASPMPPSFLEILPDVISTSESRANAMIEGQLSSVGSGESPVKKTLDDAFVFYNDEDSSKGETYLRNDCSEDDIYFENGREESKSNDDPLFNNSESSDMNREHSPESANLKKEVFAEENKELSFKEISLDLNKNIKEATKENNNFDCESKAEEAEISQIWPEPGFDTKLNAKEKDESVCFSTNQINHSEIIESSFEPNLKKDEDVTKTCLMLTGDEDKKEISELYSATDLEDSLHADTIKNCHKNSPSKNFVISVKDTENSVQLIENVRVDQNESERLEKNNAELCDVKNEKNLESFDSPIVNEEQERIKEDTGSGKVSFISETVNEKNEKDDDRKVDLLNSESFNNVNGLNSEVISVQENQSVQQESISSSKILPLAEDACVEKSPKQITTDCISSFESFNSNKSVDTSFETLYPETRKDLVSNEVVKEGESDIEDGEIIDAEDIETIEGITSVKQSEEKKFNPLSTSFEGKNVEEIEKMNKNSVVCVDIQEMEKSHFFLEKMCMKKRRVIYRRHSAELEFKETDKTIEVENPKNYKNHEQDITVLLYSGLNFRAKSCPPRIRFTSEVKTLQPDISVEDIPLPPGDAPPENWFNFDKYFKQKAQNEAGFLISELDASRKQEKNLNVFTVLCSMKEIKGKYDVDDSSVLFGMGNLQKDSEKPSHSNVVLSPLDKNFKVKFSIPKRRNLNSIISKIDDEDFEINNVKKCSREIKERDKKETAVESAVTSDFELMENKNTQKKKFKDEISEKKDGKKTRLSSFLDFEKPDGKKSFINDSKKRKTSKSSLGGKPEYAYFKESTALETPMSKFKPINVDENEGSEVSKDVIAKVQIEDEPILTFEKSECTSGEFYECEDIPTSEDLPNEDDESEKVSDDDKFRNIMQNCLDNAKKFLNVGNLKLFSCSVDDLLDLDCSNVEENDDKSTLVSNNHISRDVLLTSCEDASDDLELSKTFQPADMSMDFVPSFSNEAPHNLCPEILPVDNWPYLEEEVPSSPTKSKTEDNDLMPSLERVSEGHRDTLTKDNDGEEVVSFYISSQRNPLGDFHGQMNKMSNKDKYRRVLLPGIGTGNFKRIRRKSLMTDGVATQRRFGPERRKTIDSFTGNLLLRPKAPEKIQEGKNEVDEKSQNIWKEDEGLKCKLSLEKLTGQIQTEKKCLKYRECEKATSKTLLKDENGLIKSKAKKVISKMKSSLDYKSPCWQPKVILFRISKNQLKKIYKNSHFGRTETESNGRREMNAIRSAEISAGIVKQSSSFDIARNVESNVLDTPQKKLSLSSQEMNVSSHEKLTVLKVFSDQEVETKEKERRLINESKIFHLKGSLSSKGSEIRRKRFRNLHSKRKGERESSHKTKDINPSTPVIPKLSALVSEESETLRHCKEQSFNFHTRSSKDGNYVKNEKRNLSDERNSGTCLTEKCDKVSTSIIFDPPHGVKPKSDVWSVSENRSVKKEEDVNRKGGHSHSCENSKHREGKQKHESRPKEDKERGRTDVSKQRRESNHDKSKRSKKDGENHSSNRRDQSDSGKNDLERRRKREASSEVPWICEVCGFKDVSERVAHIKSHPFHCQSCHLAFKTEVCFVTHLTKKHKDIRNQHHCLLCELSFDTEEEYQRHLETREHRHLESVEKNTINTLFTLLTGQPCPVLGLVEMKPEWLPNQAGTVHFYHQATPLSLALQYLKMHHDLTSYSTISSDRLKF